jgi:methionyl-tRNA formyltransferase
MPTLAALYQSYRGEGPHPGLVSLLGVVTPGERPSGRGLKSTLLPVAAFASQSSLPTWTVPYGVKSLRDWEPSAPQFGSKPLGQWDLGVVVSFGYKLPPHVLSSLRDGGINVHPSLLPMYRGAAPIPHALLNGDTRTGVSIIRVDRDVIDSGGILSQEVVPIQPHDTARSLTEALARLGAQCTMNTLQGWPAALEAVRMQDSLLATPAPKLHPDLGLLVWRGRHSDLAVSNAPQMGRCGDSVSAPQDLTTELVVRKWKAFDASFGIYSFLKMKSGDPARRIKLTRLRLPPADLSLASTVLCAGRWSAGDIVFDRAHQVLWLKTTDGWLIIDELHVEYKAAPILARDFAHGLRMTATSTYRFE